MYAAGVVADHSADRAAVVRRGVGAEGEVVFLGGVAQVIEDDARPDPREALPGVHLGDVVHVLREVEHDGDVAALSGQGGPAAAGEDRRAVLARQGHGGDDIVRATRQHDADRDLPVVRGVGGVHSPRAFVEADLPLDGAPQLRGQCGGVDVDPLHAVRVVDAFPHRPRVLKRHRGKAVDVGNDSFGRGFLHRRSETSKKTGPEGGQHAFVGAHAGRARASYTPMLRGELRAQNFTPTIVLRPGELKPSTSW